MVVSVVIGPSSGSTGSPLVDARAAMVGGQVFLPFASLLRGCTFSSSPSPNLSSHARKQVKRHSLTHSLTHSSASFPRFTSFGRSRAPSGKEPLDINLSEPLNPLLLPSLIHLNNSLFTSQLTVSGGTLPFAHLPFLLMH